MRRHRLGGLARLVGLEQEHADVLRRHLRYHFRQVRRRRRNPRLRLEKGVRLEAEAPAEVAPGRVVGDDLPPLVRRRGRRSTPSSWRRSRRRTSPGWRRRRPCPPGRAQLKARARCAATILAFSGSSMKCGLPARWASPCERSAVAGMSSSWTPSEATTRPGAPARILGLRAPSSSGGSQPISSSAPPSISTSARFIATIWLGRASTKWGSSVGLAIVRHGHPVAADGGRERGVLGGRGDDLEGGSGGSRERGESEGEKERRGFRLDRHRRPHF